MIYLDVTDRLKHRDVLTLVHFMQVFHFLYRFVLPLSAIFHLELFDFFSQLRLNVLVQSQLVKSVANRRRGGLEASREENECLRG